MNILFIEDEKELASIGASQLRKSGLNVITASTIEEANAALNDPNNVINYVITDHRLPDGLGIEFVIGLRDSRPKCICAVVSGCLTDENIERLEARSIPYYRKPLLYTKVIADLRKASLAKSVEKRNGANTIHLGEKSGEKKKRRIWPFG